MIPRRRVEALAVQLHQQACHKVGEPMQDLAARLGCRVLERELPEGLEGLAIRDARTLVVSPTGYLPRDQFTIAHELVELHLPAAWLALPDVLRERICNLGASALLLPHDAYLASAVELACELPALRRRWKLASWNTLAKRMVDVGQARTAATWDHLELVSRYGPGKPCLGEEEALARCYSGWGRARVGRVGAWRLAGAGLGRAATVG